MLQDAVTQAGVAWGQVDLVAATHGPGLASSLLVGLAAARALALRLDRPVCGVNHMQAHLFANFLGADAPDPGAACPLLALLVSGGHTSLVRMARLGSYQLLGRTLDDAAGEALDKGAQLLRLGYPGGPAIERAAAGADPAFVAFPRGLQTPPGRGGRAAADHALDFSFSGLKTALRYHVARHPEIFADDTWRHVAASYQEAVFDTLLARLETAIRRERATRVACGGGVAMNQVLRRKLADLAGRLGVELRVAPPALCTDNAAMVAALAGAMWRAGLPMPSGAVDAVPNLAVDAA
jgi:N6-L-threonylcarbamoyladenine synthase